MEKSRKRRKLPRCPICGAVMHIGTVKGVKVYVCSNFDKTGCTAQLRHPDTV